MCVRGGSPCRCTPKCRWSHRTPLPRYYDTHGHDLRCYTCTYVHKDLYIYIYMYIHTCALAHLKKEMCDYIYIYISIYIYIVFRFTYVCVRMRRCAHTSSCMLAGMQCRHACFCISICVGMCVCACVYVSMCAHTYKTSYVRVCLCIRMNRA